ncbi:hypothetical protein Ocin01_14006 [Orchesella cincta]|uniref:FHF complex subunit HOOK-interacting protein C-terminal domain-containing protein n=1 Tax=Orchesella cincta TaxID=48709 RepID=A0A1D2MI31_ORCCI|nr:hypothetical protein Ocin01_14006 [Orchesella cincta]
MNNDMDVKSSSVKYSEIKQNAQLADLYSKIYGIPKQERTKVLMSWLANAYSDLLIPFLPHKEVLSTYRIHVRLLDTFANNSSYDIVAQLASEFSENFLISQVVPNLVENNEQAADVTYYIQIICEILTCPSLVRKVMDVVTTRVTPILIGRMASDETSLAASSLSLIKVLLELYCEDLWYDLVLQYLLPMKHLMTSQRQKMLPDIEFYESTQKLLELIPKRVACTISTSTLAQHFLLYFQNEILRLRTIDSSVAHALPSSKSDLQRVGYSQPESDISESARKTKKNPTYQFGFSDMMEPTFYMLFVRAIFKNQRTSNQLTPSPSADLVAQSDEDNESLKSQSLNDEYVAEIVTSIIEMTGNESLSNQELKVSSEFKSIVKDRRQSIDYLEDTNSGAYFGPFLHALFEILRNWANIHPDVLFTATEVISVLASSRIPLINTIFLDMSLILQPSYPSFCTLIHAVRNELDEHMQNYPDYLLRNVWKSAGKDCSLADAEQDDMNEGTEDDKDNFVDSLKRKISTNRSFKMAANEVQRAFRVKRTSSFRAFTDIFKPQQTTSSDIRLLNRTSSPFQSDEEERNADMMVLRGVLFTHWMLELGAIAMQLCWGRESVHGKPITSAEIKITDEAEPLVLNEATTEL